MYTQLVALDVELSEQSRVVSSEGCVIPPKINDLVETSRDLRSFLVKKNPVRVVKIRSNFSRPSLVVVSFGVGQLYRSSRHRVPVNSRGLEAFFCAHAGHRRTTRQQLLRLLRCQVASCKLQVADSATTKAKGGRSDERSRDGDVEAPCPPVPELLLIIMH